MTRNTKARYVLAIIFWILTIMILSCTFVFAQTYNDTNKFTDRQRDGFLGPVKSVSFFFDGVSTPVWRRLYREDGSREMVEYMIGSEMIITTFDNKGRTIKSEILRQGKKELTSYSIYDDLNHSCTTYFQDAEHVSKEIIRQLTDDGKDLETRNYSPSGEYIGNRLYAYNEQGLLVLMIKNNKHGIPFETYKTVYDSAGRILEMNRYDNKNYKDPTQSILAYKENYTYDSKGCLTEKRIYFGNSQNLSTIVTFMNFDKYGNSTKQVHENVDQVVNKNFPPIKFVEYAYFE